MEAAVEKFQKQLLFAKAITKDTMQDKPRRPRTAEHCDRVAECLRRWTANPVGLRAWVRIPSLSVLFHMEAAVENFKNNYYSQKQSEKIHCRTSHEDLEQQNIVTGWPSG